MMHLLILVFLIMALYGALTAHMGAALMALGMAGVCMYARLHFDRQDREWTEDPANAPVLNSNTQQALDTHECECMQTKIQP